MRLKFPRTLRKATARAARRSSRSSLLSPAQVVRRRVILAGSILGLFVGVKAMVAQTTIWTNTAADQLWSTSGNWTNGIPNATADVLFPATVPAGGATSLIRRARGR